MNKTKPDVTLSGHFKLIVRDAATHEIRRDIEFDNLILNAGLNRYGTGVISGGVAIGTGTTAPAVTDTQLQTISAWTTVAGNGSGSTAGVSPDYIASSVYSYQFQAGQLNGTYYEVGFGWGSTTLFSRALIVDGGGTPTPITVGTTEYLTVLYTLRLVPNLSDVAGTVTIGGTTYNTVRRPAYLGSVSYWRPMYSQASFAGGNYGGALASVFDGTLGAVTGYPSGNYGQLFTSSDDTYVNNSYEKGGSITMGLSQCNLPGNQFTCLVVYSSCCAYQYSFDVPVPKDSTRVITITGKLTWGRA